jgi:O-antigen/teichoic acid export membrane protein
MSENFFKLTEGRLLARNTVYSLVGQAFPVLVAIFSIPILIREMGVDGFGVLTLAWMVTGYFGFLDLGVGRALTKLVSERLGQNNLADIPELIWTGLMLTIVMGVFTGVIMSQISPFLANDVFNIPVDIRRDAEISFLVLSASVPIVTSVSVLRDLLSAYQRFDLVNIVRAPIGSLTFLAPLITLTVSTELTHIVFSLVLVRIVEWGVSFLFCVRVVPDMARRICVDRSKIFQFLKFGGWMTVSNICGPAMLYADRFMIGSIITVSAVSYYAASFEVISRLMIVPGAIVGVLFPAFSAVIRSDPEKAIFLCVNGIKYTFISVAPLLVIIYIFAYEGLTIWLGNEFSGRGGGVLQWLVIGALVNSFSYFPASLLHAAGRPDLTAKLHLVEMPIYITVVWFLVNFYGIEGAAIAWVMRSIVDNVVLFQLAGRVLKLNIIRIQNMAPVVAFPSVLFASLLLPDDIYLKAAYALSLIIFILLLMWRKFLSLDEKAVVNSWVTKFSK